MDRIKIKHGFENDYFKKKKKKLFPFGGTQRF